MKSRRNLLLFTVVMITLIIVVIYGFKKLRYDYKKAQILSCLASIGAKIQAQLRQDDNVTFINYYDNWKDFDVAGVESVLHAKNYLTDLDCMGLSADGVLFDPWGRIVQMKAQKIPSGIVVILRSAGADGTFGTKDDVRWPSP